MELCFIDQYFHELLLCLSSSVFLVEDYVLYGIDLLFAEHRWTLVGRHEMVLLFRRKESNKEAALLARALLALQRRGKSCGHALFGLHLTIQRSSETM